MFLSYRKLNCAKPAPGKSKALNANGLEVSEHTDIGETWL